MLKLFLFLNYLPFQLAINRIIFRTVNEKYFNDNKVNNFYNN